MHSGGLRPDGDRGLQSGFKYHLTGRIGQADFQGFRGIVLSSPVVSVSRKSGARLSQSYACRAIRPLVLLSLDKTESRWPARSCLLVSGRSRIGTQSAIRYTANLPP